MTSSIIANRLTKKFENVTAVKSVSLDVASGEVFGVVGPDGAGKTTLIRMLCGIIEPTSGTAEVMGVNSTREIGKVISDVGYMSQRFSLYGDLSVSENIEFFADIHDVPRSVLKERTENLLRASRLEPFQKRLAQDLSGGMKQKLALVCTLIHTPKVLFLDEPTTGVDPISRRDFWQILYGLVAEGMTLFVSTPYMDEADRCQRLALMSRGEILICDTPANLRRHMTRTVIEVDSPLPRDAGSFLESLPEIRSVEAFGARLHATALPSIQIEQLRKQLLENSIPINDIRIVPPTLEDAFIARMEDADAP